MGGITVTMQQQVHPNRTGRQRGTVMATSPKFSRLVAVWVHVADLRTAATGSQIRLDDWEIIKIMLMEKWRRQRLIQHTEPSHIHTLYPFIYLA